MILQLRKMLDLLIHASTCRSGSWTGCKYPNSNCRKVKGLFRHGMLCKTRASGGCALCKKMWYMLQLHARACRDSGCIVPRCRCVVVLSIICPATAISLVLTHLIFQSCWVTPDHHLWKSYRDMKEHLRRLQQQYDSRRRAAVNEMMRQRFFWSLSKIQQQSDSRDLKFLRFKQAL
jgi:E1A/CREB-binding protein